MAESDISLAGRIPDGWVRQFLRYWKYQARCLAHNRQAGRPCRARYARGQFTFEYPQFGVRFYDDCWFDLLVATPGYLAEHSLQSGAVVVDGGAFIGAFAVVAAKLVGPTGRVITFEPDSVNRARLLRNLELNGLDNVTVLGKGLWDKTERLCFSDEHHGGSAILEGGAPGGVEIEAVSLDEELARLHVTVVDFIKMDIEGAELRAVEGCQRLMAACRPAFAIASYHTVAGQQSSHALEAWFAAHDYRAHTACPRHITTYAAPK